jgi:hypothetical protein
MTDIVNVEQQRAQLIKWILFIYSFKEIAQPFDVLTFSNFTRKTIQNGELALKVQWQLSAVSTTALSHWNKATIAIIWFSCFVCFRTHPQHVQWTCVSVTGCFGTNISLDERVSLQVCVHTLSKLEIGKISSILNQPAQTPGQYIKPKTVPPKPWQTLTIHSSVGRPIAIGLQAVRLWSWGSIPDMSQKIFSSSQSPYWLWDPSYLLHNGKSRLLP